MNAKDTITAIAQFLAALSQVEEYWSHLYDEVGRADLETQDLLHEFELSKFNAYGGFSLAAQLQEVRKRRRKNKNEKETIEPFKRWAENHKTLTIELYKIVKAMEKSLETQQTRQYFPRVREDFKEAVNGKNTR